jgi:type IV secretion system protein VirB5
MGKWVKMTAVTLAMAAGIGAAEAQGIPVFDFAAIAQAIQQLEQAKQQLSQMQSTHNSFNKLTNMGDIAAVLNQPSIRQALPNDYNSVKQALTGTSSGSQSFYDQNTLYSSGTPSASDSAYAAEIERQKRGTAGTQSIAQTFYDAASKRQSGIEQLRQQIGQSEDPKTTMDLQARMAVETLAAQNDLARINALNMLVAAQDKVDLQRSSEQHQQRMDNVIKAYGGNVPPS